MNFLKPPWDCPTFLSRDKGLCITLCHLCMMTNIYDSWYKCTLKLISVISQPIFSCLLFSSHFKVPTPLLRLYQGELWPPFGGLTPNFGGWMPMLLLFFYNNYFEQEFNHCNSGLCPTCTSLTPISPLSCMLLFNPPQQPIQNATY